MNLYIITFSDARGISDASKDMQGPHSKHFSGQREGMSMV